MPPHPLKLYITEHSLKARDETNKTADDWLVISSFHFPRVCLMALPPFGHTSLKKKKKLFTVVFVSPFVEKIVQERQIAVLVAFNPWTSTGLHLATVL